MGAVEAMPVPQHMAALANANRVRLARSALKRRVARGELSAAAVIDEVPWEAETMAVGELLMAQHRWGRTRVRRLLGSIPMGELKQLGSLTPRQRTVLISLLGGE